MHVTELCAFAQGGIRAGDGQLCMLAACFARLIISAFSCWDMLWTALCVLDVSLLSWSALFLVETWLLPESGS
jgi:hypothetical protein